MYLKTVSSFFRKVGNSPSLVRVPGMAFSPNYLLTTGPWIVF